MLKKYIIAFIPVPQGTEKHRVTHEFETSAQPGTYSFWHHVLCSFPGTVEKLEWAAA